MQYGPPLSYYPVSFMYVCVYMCAGVLRSGLSTYDPAGRGAYLGVHVDCAIAFFPDGLDGVQQSGVEFRKHKSLLRCLESVPVDLSILITLLPSIYSSLLAVAILPHSTHASTCGHCNHVPSQASYTHVFKSTTQSGLVISRWKFGEHHSITPQW